MNIKQLNEVPIIEFLAREGIQPTKKHQTSWWYYSPIRAKERTPSFKVDIKINRWFDHGTGKGGKLFDLALLLFKTTDVKSVVDALNNKYSLSRPSFVQNLSSNEEGERLIIEKVRPFGFSKPLIHYLQSRGIAFEIAAPYCKDILFSLRGKKYYAIGFENRSGGYELRNSFFKGSSSPKDLTYLNNKSNSINVMEGFVDFLSLRTLQTFPSPVDFLILNSLSFVVRSLPILMQYNEVSLFLNNDKSGKNATDLIKDEISLANDKSSFYKGHNDVNDYLLKKAIACDNKVKRNRIK